MHFRMNILTFITLGLRLLKNSFSFPKMSVSSDNFIKAVYQLSHDEQQKAVSAHLVLRLGISGAAVTDMAKHLANKGLVEYQPYKEIKLTKVGKAKAIAIIRRHRLWETFLVQVLKIPWEKVHTEAELLEHQTSDYLLEKIDAYLAFPRVDPHGDSIPDKNGNIPEDKAEDKLSKAHAGSLRTLTRVHHHDDDLMKFFIDHAIKPGQEIKIVNGMDKFGIMLIIVDENQIVIPEKIAENMYVKHNTK